MSVSGAGAYGEIVRGSPAHLAAAIKDDSAYQKRHNEVLNSFTDRDTALVWAKARTQEVTMFTHQENHAIRRHATTRSASIVTHQHLNLSNRS